MPWDLSTASSGASGREGSLPSRRMAAEMPSAPRMGMRKRRVEPDSPTCREISCVGRAVRSSGVTAYPQSVFSMTAPSAQRQRTVASMSSFVPLQRIRTEDDPAESAARIRRRCAADLDGGAAAIGDLQGKDVGFCNVIVICFDVMNVPLFRCRGRETRCSHRQDRNTEKRVPGYRQ